MNRRRFLTEMAAGATLALGVCPAREADSANAGAGGGDSFCYCVVADPHCANAPTKGLEKYGSGLDKFLMTARAIEALDAEDKPDFMLLLGDIHPAALKERLTEIKIPIHATPGNHEATREQRKLLYEMFPDDFHIAGIRSDYYSFVHKGVRFISICDAGAGEDHIGHFCSEVTEPSGQCEWIERELASPETRKVVFAHIPLEREGEDRSMFLSRNDSRWFKDVIVRTKPSAAYFGHLHQATEEYRIGDTRLFQVRSCSWNFSDAALGFLHVRMTPEGLTYREILTAEYA